MSGLVCRILLTVLMFPLASLVYLVSFVFYGRSASFSSYSYSAFSLPPCETANVVAGVVTCIYIAGNWIVLWRQSVHWGARRVRQTLWLVPAAIVAGVIIGLIVYPIERHVGAFVGS